MFLSGCGEQHLFSLQIRESVGEILRINTGSSLFQSPKKKEKEKKRLSEAQLNSAETQNLRHRLLPVSPLLVVKSCFNL